MQPCLKSTSNNPEILSGRKSYQEIAMKKELRLKVWSQDYLEAENYSARNGESEQMNVLHQKK